MALLASLKALGIAVAGFVGKIVGSASMLAIGKCGLFVGAAIGAAVVVEKMGSATLCKSKKKKSKSKPIIIDLEDDDEDENDDDPSGLRHDYEFFEKHGQLHPEMDVIEEYNDTISDNIRKEMRQSYSNCYTGKKSSKSSKSSKKSVGYGDDDRRVRRHICANNKAAEEIMAANEIIGRLLSNSFGPADIGFRECYE